MAMFTSFLAILVFSLSVGGVSALHSQVDIDLSTGVVRGYSEQIRFILTPSRDESPISDVTAAGTTCSRKAIIRVDFGSGQFKVARVVLKYGDSPRRWTFDASDSPLADGYGSVVSSPLASSGHHNLTFGAMAEIQVLNRQLRVYGRWPAPSLNLYAKSTHKMEQEVFSEETPDESEESPRSEEASPGVMSDGGSSREAAASSETPPGDPPAGDDDQEDDQEGEEDVGSGRGGGVRHHSTGTPTPTLPLGGSRMFVRVLDGTVQPHGHVELVVGSKGRSLWWRDGRASHELPAPPGFLRQHQRRHSGSSSSLYLSFNRVLGGEWRSGSGLCAISVQMMEAEDQCPSAQNSCDKNAVCKPSRVGHQCSCKKGWQGDGITCSDIDECRIRNGGCSHICKNELGTHSCDCLPGFTPDPDDPNNCIDVDECAGRTKQGAPMHSCDHSCQNVIGSYECQCRKGYHLASDGHRCIAGSDSCPASLGCRYGCELDFSSHVGARVGIRCSCPRGYALDERDMKLCVPTCSIGNGGCQHVCHDAASTATGPARKGVAHGNSRRPSCSCQPKYLLGADGRTCYASCSVNNGGCQKKCTTTMKGVVCSCPMGYILNEDGKTCSDIDECVSGNVTCEYGCANSIGSFECLCPSGYRLNPADERTCLDMDECSIENTCEHKCINTPGSYVCECKAGYQSFGISHCGDINECYINNGGCSHKCINTPGSYYCGCHMGYQLHPNGKDCIGVETSNSFSCGQQLKYQTVSGETSTEIAHQGVSRCQDSVSSTKYLMTARFFFTGTKCTSLAQMKTTAEALIEELNAKNMQNCSRDCRLQVSRVRCENSKKVLKKLGKDKGDVIRVVFQIVSRPSNSSESCAGSCERKSASKVLWQAANHLKKSLNGARFSVKPLDEELVIIPRSFHARRSIQQSCQEQFNSTNEICEFCHPGTFSANGQVPCEPCPMGTYQPDRGRLACIDSGAKHSSATGARSFTETSASELCTPGSYYSKELKSCISCPKGTYQHRRGQNFCIPCPGNSSTDYSGSKHVDDCKRSNCVSFINDLFGVIESPNYPGNYPNNIDCTWIVKPGRGRRLLVIVPDIKLANDKCGDYLVMRKSKSPYSVTTYEACESSNHPIAFTARTKRLWMQFKSDGNNTSTGFHIPFVTYNEEYQALIEDIVQDSRLYASVSHLRILQDRKLLMALMEVIAQPINYYKYANDQRKILPGSFIRLMTPKVRKFFSYR
ncbi:signal peptide, CUB and EGF-like domain-containing protein 2 [Hetaerina americana]|uniref:signal peptide, CUB and EGF-like domain-containing protein 2 n=1 Tax=Hetaerina americana TaxID=62018 RepID=UPI003A7F2006